MKYKVTYTDTFNGEANFCWKEEYYIEASNIKSAITKAKQIRYYAPIPRHTIQCWIEDIIRIDIVGQCVCAFIEEDN